MSVRIIDPISEAGFAPEAVVPQVGGSSLRLELTNEASTEQISPEPDPKSNASLEEVIRKFPVGRKEDRSVFSLADEVLVSIFSLSDILGVADIDNLNPAAGRLNDPTHGLVSFRKD